MTLDLHLFKKVCDGLIPFVYVKNDFMYSYAENSSAEIDNEKSKCNDLGFASNVYFIFQKTDKVFSKY